MAEETSIAGGRLLGTKPVADAVEAMKNEIVSLSAALRLTREQITSEARKSGARAATARTVAGDVWNGTSHWGGWGRANGGGSTFNLRQAQGSGFNLTNAGIQFNQPAGTQSVGNYRTANPGQPGPPGGGRGWGGIPNGGARAGTGLVTTATAFATWGNRHRDTMTQGDALGTFVANNGGYGGNVTRSAMGLTSNMSIGNGVQDRIQAQGLAVTNLGGQAFRGGFNNSLRAGGYLNPSMSAENIMQAQVGWNSASTFNQMRMYGVNTIGAGGRNRSTYAINRDMASRLGVGGAMNNSQIKASLYNQNSQAIVSLRSMGMSEDQISLFREQTATRSRLLNRGATAGEADRLLSQAGGQGDKADRASDILSRKYGIKETALQAQKRAQAAGDDARMSTVGGFREGLMKASGAVADFTNAVQSFLSTTKLGGAAGFTGGASSVFSSAATSAGTVLGGAAGLKMLGMWGARNAMSKVGGAEALGSKFLGAGSKVASVGRFAKFAGPVGVALTAADWAIHGKRAWDKGIRNGHGQLGGRELLSMDTTNPAMAAGSLWGLGQAVSSLHTGMGGATEGGRPGGGDHQGGTSAQAVVARARAASQNGTYYGVGYCQNFVRTTIGAPGGASDAAAAWARAKFKHTDGTPPAGASVFWLGGSEGHGHVAVSAGGGMVYSTDVKRKGKVDLTSISWINQHWRSLKYVGWTEDNNGTRVKTGPGGGSMAGGGDAAGAIAAGLSTATSTGTGPGSSFAGAYGSINESDAITAALAGSAVPGNSTGSTGQAGDSATMGKPEGGSIGSAPSDPKGNAALVKKLAASRGWTGSQWDALYQLVKHESGFNNKADNPTSTAHGLFQFLDSTWGSHKKTDDPTLQTKYGLDYIKGRYGDPTKAWSFWQKNNWYDKGAWNVPGDQDAVVHKGEMIIPARQAETIRAALLKEANPTSEQRSTGGGVVLQFQPGSIVLKVDSMDEGSGRKLAKAFVDHIAEDKRIEKMAVGA